MLPTSTNVSIEFQTRPASNLPVVAVFAPKGAKDAGPAGALLDADQRQAVRRMLAAGVARGKAREVSVDLLESTGRLPTARAYRRVLIVGLGEEAKITADTYRQAAGALARTAAKNHLKTVALALSPAKSINSQALVKAVVEGFLLASFKYAEYKGTAAKKDKDDADDGHVVLKLLYSPVAKDASVAELRRAMERARIIADAQNFARTIASRPGNDINPVSLVGIVKDMARQSHLSCRVLDHKELARLHMGGILAVGGASATPPRIIALEYRPHGAKANQRPLLVVGKTITFDAGGISIKPADKMGQMVFDKCGGMAVLGFMQAVAALKLPQRVVGILTAAENLLGSHSYRPGDLLRMYNGVTVEVTNTDAEGRLVLGDALAWGIDTYKPSQVVDLATLTGGVVIALGTSIAALMGNNDVLAAELMTAAEMAGEKIWRLPLGEEHREQIKSHLADIVNSAGRNAQTIQGAAFISHFLGKDDSLPWAHIDIAGVADTDKELPYYAKGVTGWGVRTLIEWLAAKAV